MKNITKYNSSAVDYYNSISAKYDDLLDTNPLNEKLREEVKRYFLENVNGKTVIDFGGGTGNDLHWLIESGFSVIFCEPAEKMKEIAEVNVKKINESDKVTFLSKYNSDFQTWSKDKLPFDGKADAVLSNFAVLNSIKDLNSLSDKLSLVTRENANLIAVVLNINVKYMIRNSINILKSIGKGCGLAVKINYGKTFLITYLHRRKILISSLSKHFKLIRSFPLSDESFLIIHFVRNEKIV